MTDIATLALKVDATDAGKAAKELYNLITAATKTEKASFALGRAIGLTAVALTAAAGASVLMTKNAIDAADAMNDLHIKTGLSLQSLAAYSLLADQSGTTINNVATGFKFLGKYIIEHGEKLRSIGITSKDSNVAMGQFADLISGIKDPATKSALAMEILGKSGVELLPLLEGGSAAFKDAGENSNEYGNILTRIAPMADEFNDKLAIIKNQAKETGASLAEYFLPSLNEIAAVFIKTKTESGLLVAALTAIGMAEYKLVGIQTDEVIVTQERVNALFKESYDLKVKIANFEASGMSGSIIVNDLKEKKAAIDQIIKTENNWLANQAIKSNAEKDEIKRAKEKRESDAKNQEQNIKNLLVAEKTNEIKKAQLAFDLGNVKNAASEEINIIKNKEKILDSDRQNYLISESDYYDQKRELIIRNGELNEQDLKGQLSVLSENKLIGKEKIENDTKIAKAQSEIRKANEDTITSLELLDKKQDEMRKKKDWTHGITTSLRKFKEEASDVAANVEKMMTNMSNGIVDGVASSVSKSIVYGKNLQESLSAVAYNVADAFITAAIKIGIQQLIINQGAKSAYAATLVTQTQSTAMIAAENAYASTILTPIVGPVEAPIAAAAAYETAMGFGSAAVALASARNGYDIPAGVNPITQLHEKEMVLPAPQAQVIRDMAKTGGGTGINITSSPIINIDSRTDKADIYKIVKNAVAQGNEMLVDSLKRQGKMA